VNQHPDPLFGEILQWFTRRRYCAGFFSRPGFFRAIVFAIAKEKSIRDFSGKIIHRDHDRD
jgi:hypothetical protein